MAVVPWTAVRLERQPVGSPTCRSQLVVIKDIFDFGYHEDVSEFEAPPPVAGEPCLAETDAMRALSHPLRWALIDALETEGEATAARCGQILGQPQANCSYHLRMLAKYGLVEEATSSSRRDRPWRLKARKQTWSSVQPTPEARAAAQELSRAFVEHETRKLLEWIHTRNSLPEEWQRAASISGTFAWLTAEELNQVAADLQAALQPYLIRSENRADRPAHSLLVRLFEASYPINSATGGEQPDAT